MARLSAGVGATRLTCRRPQVVLPHASLLPVACQLVKRNWSEISLYVSLYKFKTLLFAVDLSKFLIGDVFT